LIIGVMLFFFKNTCILKLLLENFVPTLKGIHKKWRKQYYILLLKWTA